MCTESKISANYIAKGVRQAKHAIGTQIEKKEKRKWQDGREKKEKSIFFFLMWPERRKRKNLGFSFLQVNLKSDSVIFITIILPWWLRR